MSVDEPSAAGYGTVARMLHWLTVLLVAIMLGAGIAMTSEGFAAWGDQLFIMHKNLGVIVFVVIVIRLVWRLFHKPAPLPATLPDRQRRIAAVSHAMLYILLLAMTVTGYLRVVGGGFPIELLNALGVPPLVPPLGEMATTLSVIHKFIAYLLVAMMAAHVTAAMHHALIARDTVINRIWPPIAPRD